MWNMFVNKTRSWDHIHLSVYKLYSTASFIWNIQAHTIPFNCFPELNCNGCAYVSVFMCVFCVCVCGSMVGGMNNRAIGIWTVEMKKWRSSLPYWRGSRQSEVRSSTVAFWQIFQMLKYIKTGREVKAVTPSQASMKMYVSMMNCRGNSGTRIQFRCRLLL